jgi:hypothetical protein
VFPPADPIEPTPDPDLPVTSPDTPGWPDLPDPGPGLPGGELPFPDLGGGFNPGYGGENNPIVIIDQIVNLGQKIWKIVADNQPVLDIKYKYANAIPKGLDATELENFSPIQYKTFRFRGKNGYGAQVFDIAYTVVHRYGGKYLDTGHFLERVSVVPNKVEALWGYKVNFNVLNVSVANVGSKDEPIASMGVDAQLDVGTIIKKSSRRLMFEFRGDSDSVRRIAAEAL